MKNFKKLTLLAILAANAIQIVPSDSNEKLGRNLLYTGIAAIISIAAYSKYLEYANEAEEEEKLKTLTSYNTKRNQGSQLQADTAPLWMRLNAAKAIGRIESPDFDCYTAPLTQ